MAAVFGLRPFSFEAFVPPRSRVNLLCYDYVSAVSCEETPEMISGHHVNTHVFVSDSRRGYGVSIQDMLEAAEIAEEQAA